MVKNNKSVIWVMRESLKCKIKRKKTVNIAFVSLQDFHCKWRFVFQIVLT